MDRKDASAAADTDADAAGSVDAAATAASAADVERDTDARAPEALRVLATQFAALEFGLSSLALYQRTPDWDAARLAVESSTQRALSLSQLRQMLVLLPGAYALAWRKQKRGGARESGQGGVQSPWVLTIRKLPLAADTTGGHLEPATMTERIALFRASVHAWVDLKTRELRRQDAELEGDALARALEQVELEMAPLPDAPTASTSSSAGKPTAEPRQQQQQQQEGEEKEEEEKNDERAAAKQADALKAALEAPVPPELQSLPPWLVEKVRRRELAGQETARRAARALEKRVVSSLPQLSDQLEALALSTRKTVFALDALEQQLGARAPVRGKLRAQVELLEVMVPFWLSVRLSGGRQYVQLERKAKYNRVKAALRQAVAEALERL